jgi:hypothetical protein
LEGDLLPVPSTGERHRAERCLRCRTLLEVERRDQLAGGFAAAPAEQEVASLEDGRIRRRPGPDALDDDPGLPDLAGGGLGPRSRANEARSASRVPTSSHLLLLAADAPGYDGGLNLSGEERFERAAITDPA